MQATAGPTTRSAETHSSLPATSIICSLMQAAACFPCINFLGLSILSVVLTMCACAIKA
jgi:hypothetical protein